MLTGITGARGQKAWKEHTVESPVLFFVELLVSPLTKIKQYKSNPSSDHHGEPASWVLFSAVNFNYTLKPRA